MDELEFPRFMCKKGGGWELETGMYWVRTVADKAEAELALADGWTFSQYDEPNSTETTERQRLEAEAKSLGLTWRKNASDESLAALIEEAKKASGN